MESDTTAVDQKPGLADTESWTFPTIGWVLMGGFVCVAILALGVWTLLNVPVPEVTQPPDGGPTPLWPIAAVLVVGYVVVRLALAAIRSLEAPPPERKRR